MSNPITAPFTQHPAKVGETYVQHMGVAFGFAGWLLLAGAAAVVHALVPAMCESTASRIIARLHARMETRH